MSWVCLSFTKPLERQYEMLANLSHTESTEIVDVAKLSPAALTAGNAEEGEMERGKGGEGRRVK